MLESVYSALTPFLWGGALALFLNVPLHGAEACLKRLPGRWRRAAALTAVLAALAVALGLGLWLLLPQLLNAAAQLAAVLPRLAGDLTRLLTENAPGGTEGRQLLLGVLQDADRAGEDALAGILGAGMDAAVNAAGMAGTLLVSLVLAVYLLADKENLARKCIRVLYAALGSRRAGRITALARRGGRIFSQFVAGQCIEACILAGLFVLTMFAFRMPNVLPIAAVIGVTALVPVFGSFLGCAVGVALILPQSLEKAGWFIVLFLCVQQFENNVIYPRVVGGRIGLPPLWVMTAVILGGGLFGLPGLLLGIPAMSVLYHVGGEWVRGRLDRGEEAG